MRYLLCFLFLFSSVFADDLSQRLEKLIQDKKIKTVTILKYDPFFEKGKKKQFKKHHLIIHRSRKKIALKLVAILGNRAFINGKWFSKGDKIDGYRIKKVFQDRVMLYKQDKIKVLRFEKNKNILNVKDK